MADYMFWVWLILLALFTVTELATAQLTTVWFALGALVAALLTAFGVENLIIQIAVFLIVSFVSLILTRPLVRKLTHNKKTATNADMVIGKEAIVTEAINNLESRGQVKINGQIWTARSADGNEIPAGMSVTVKEISGVKLIVTE